MFQRAPRLIVCAFITMSCRVERVSRDDSANSNSTHATVWIYTSMYRHVADAIQLELTKQHPNIATEWVQAGSEKIVSRLETELSGGNPRADIIAISDPFFYARLKREDRWLPHLSPNALHIPSE